MKWFARSTIGAFVTLGLWCCASRDTGRWKCTSCGAHERRTTVGPFFWKRELPSEYHQWFIQNVALAHDHDWIWVGCHERASFISGRISCSMRELEFQDGIRGIPDSALAVTAAKRLSGLAAGERLEELRDAEGAVGWTFLLPYPLRAEDLKVRGFNSGNYNRYRGWWESKRRWQDVFPKPIE